MSRTLLGLVLTLVLSSVAVAAGRTSTAAADFSGRWSGTIAIPENGKRVKSGLHATFKHAGEELTGSVGPDPAAQLPITKGRVEITKFGTVMTFEMPGQGFVMRFELREDHGVLRGLARLAGQPGQAPVELQPSEK
ncbi:MAG TPA: hypothetical protein VN700_00390 [Vicinamibacterales bacterium]|nr:hypothetical protein [Vicinamibacterales bacterium]